MAQNYEVSVLTAVYQPNGQYVWEAYESLKQQDINWQWVVQIDGPETAAGQLPETIRQDDRVCIAANGYHIGAAATRNLALLRCSHDLIQNLDADDTFYPNALPRLADAISTKGVAFAFGQSHNSYPDGRLEHWQPAPWTSGILNPGHITDRWIDSGRHHVSLSATMWKAIYVHAYGGWGAMIGMEDVYMMLAIGDDHAAAYVDEPITKYRRHELQATQSPDLKTRELEHRMLVAARILAARSLKNTHLKRTGHTFAEPGTGKLVELPFPIAEN